MWETKKFTENKFSLINAQFGNMFHSASKKEKKKFRGQECCTS